MMIFIDAATKRVPCRIHSLTGGAQHRRRLHDNLIRTPDLAAADG
jgi:hypothetical protein